MSDEIRIFISYAREDQARVRALYDQLVAAGFHPWLDREHILPGQRWEPIIKQALKRADFALVCLSATSINKRGFLQKEIKQALEHVQEKLEDDVWLIPARLDDCDVPDSLSEIQWVDLFEEDGVEQLLRAIEFQLKKENRRVPAASAKAAPSIAVPKEEPRIIARPPASLVDRFEMVSLPGGEFAMGSEDYSDEQPPHRVRVSPFSIGKYPVTQAQWKAVMGESNNPSRFQGDDLPVEKVSWDDVQEFLEKLGNGFRLPTEAEWEYAARGGTTTAYSFGDDASQLGEYAWFSDNSQGKTHPVGKKRPNPFGLYDMHGNGWEWCSDWYSSGYYGECEKQGTVIDPQGPKSGSNRVFRGGGWSNIAVVCRSAYRYFDSPGDRSDHLGFRLVRVGRIP